MTANAGSSILNQSPTSAEEIQVRELAFDVARIDLPADGVRHGRKIWNHVDELRIDPERVANLARNGLRIGVASPEAWPALRAIFEAAHAEVRRDQLVVQRGFPLTILLASIHQEGEYIFTYDPNGRLAGKTFPAGDKLLTVDYVFHPRFAGCTDLQLGFEIRHDRGVMTWEKRGGVIRQTPAYDRHVFSDLATMLTLNPHEFLVIGLSDQARTGYLVGSRFLTLQRSGRPYETLLCITPTPYSTKAVRRRSL